MKPHDLPSQCFMTAKVRVEDRSAGPSISGPYSSAFSPSPGVGDGVANPTTAGAIDVAGEVYYWVPARYRTSLSKEPYEVRIQSCKFDSTVALHAPATWRELSFHVGLRPIVPANPLRGSDSGVLVHGTRHMRGKDIRPPPASSTPQALSLPVTCRSLAAFTSTKTPVPLTGARTTQRLSSSMATPGTAVSTMFSFLIRKLKATHAHYATGIFSKLVPLSTTYNVRVVLVNRQDYPGSVPYSKEDRAALDAAAAEVESDPAAAQATVLLFLKAIAQDLYNFLTEFVAKNDIPKASADRDSGGLVVGG